jgi:enoyl-CoA hydratase
MTHEPMIARKAEGVGWMTFNNPERHNALTDAMCERVIEILADFEADPQVRLCVMSGAGDKAFVSGADISQFEKQRSGPEAVQHYEEISEAAQQKLMAFDKPVIAMIRGYCLGAGVNIANCCDLRIAAEDARFGIPAARMGLGYRASSMKNLVDVVGAPNAREIMITARQLTAAEAKDMGLIHKITSNEGLEKATREYCDAISANAPLTMRAAKRMIRELLKRDYDVELMRKWMRECYDSADYAEGRKAFMEKRKPAFKGS